MMAHEIIIPKEKAVFWMDHRGRWCNADGPFRHKKIIDHFNASIRKDDQGYYVEQVRDATHEKVYFRYAETPLFAVEIISLKPITLRLNTGRIIPLAPESLFIRKDQLYMRMESECIQFSERVLFKLADQMKREQGAFVFHYEGRDYLLRTID